MQPGCLVRWRYRLDLPPGAPGRALEEVAKEAQAALPEAGWDVRTRDNA